MNKKGFLVLLIAISAVFATSCRYWRNRGFGWHRRGWGYHRPWGGSGYYGRGGWWGAPGFGITIVSGNKRQPSQYYDDYVDSQGKDYWRVFNDTPYSIRFKAEGHDSRTLSPGESRKVPHEYGFDFYVEANGRSISSSTSHHRIKIYDRGRGKIGIRKSR
ncbi:hypothetical protein KC460_01975 [Candidatus Dependentiae bacterium]|nr:hypothetical protein [Candidatus Dependentiae bacterium]